jgi:4-amino-4-deoxychorismate lyase
MNVAFVTHDGMLVHPKFDHVLAGCTSLRLLELARQSQNQVGLKGVEVRDIAVADALASREMLLIGSSVRVAPVVHWDEHVIGGGRPGPIAKALLRLLDDDMRSGDRLIPVPY